jgi:hypothetical protein
MRKFIEVKGASRPPSVVGNRSSRDEPFGDNADNDNDEFTEEWKDREGS